MNITTQELWRAVPDYEDRYEVSSLGRVRSLRHPNGSMRLEPRDLAACPDTRGYPQVRIVGLSRNVHRLVLLAFVGPPPLGHEGAHLNGIPTDNRLVNLRWVTRIENLSHRRDHGTLATGDRHGTHTHPERLACGSANGRAKLTAKEVLEIRAACATGATGPSVAARYGVNPSTVGRIARREKWAHIPEVAL